MVRMDRAQDKMFKFLQNSTSLFSVIALAERDTARR
jgi:hypothetical protein